MKRMNLFFIFLILLFTLGVTSSFLTGSLDLSWKIILFLLIWLGGIGFIGFTWYYYWQQYVKLSQIANEIVNYPHLNQHPWRDKDEFAEVVQSLNQLGKRIIKEEKLRGHMIADIAHELRTPLTILRSQLETLVLEGKAVSIQQLIPLVDETIHMQRLIHDLQELSLAEANQISLKRSWFGFQAWLEEIVDILKTQAIEKEIKVEIEGRILNEVYWDSSRMKQVLINLLGNAIKYTEHGGKVKVAVCQAQGIVKIQVIDNGPGIPPEKLPYIFQRFYRVEGSRNRSLGGAGLGLAIAKEFVEAHKGSIGVESECGEGTTFTIELPVFPDE
ncbi:sensor histidine kinase [Thermoflavimicrobium dichotomicum]|uniref:histidine kinase n=1 Tax=Thermoflavimicrobium dichotomicum TaxID=46223 RepID=A0A1I3JDL6_9BACL|nr:HAMP domain-containing sensor histidine kinase [Thermoflavimicrobium dichotomicum]SFI58035.1 two-component system, OmpR family, sensor histidine kinase BaeS [Thermoflavimicrobium dichotomicum]